MLKLQSAIEYLTTYGWAVLLIAIALVFLFELGVFNRSPPTQCILESGFGCTNFYMTSNGILVFNLEQQTINPVNITGIACYENSTLLSGQKPYNPPSNQLFMPVGSSQTMYVQCYTSNTIAYSGNIGSVFSGTLAIYYTDAITHLTEFAKGSLTVPISTSEQIATAGNSDVENSITLTITDTTSSAVPSGFQQMFSINPSTFAQNGLNANMSNIEFTTGVGGSGIPVNAWIESGASNTATSSIIWLKLPDGITSNGGTETLYMNFLSNNNPITSGVTGYAPELWCASGCFQTGYAEYDNGANVFNKYDNFVGTSLSSLWVPTGITYTVNNGITITSISSAVSFASSGIIYNTNLYGGNYIVDSYQKLSGNGASAPIALVYKNSINTNSITGSALVQIWSNSNFYTSTTQPTTSWPTQIALPQSLIVGDNYILSLSYPTDISAGAYENYESVGSPPYPMYDSATVYAMILGGYQTSSSDWFRIRAYPPNGVMPSVQCSSGTCTN